MSDKISAVTEAVTLDNEDLFALAKYTGSGPTGFASRHITAATVISELVSNETFITNLTENTDFVTNIALNETFVTELVGGPTFITELIESPEFITNNFTTLRTVVEEETGTTYTLVLGDASHRWKTLSDADPVVVTVPPESDVDWPDNTYIELEQGGVGEVTVVGGVGVTVNYNDNLSNALNGQYAVAALKKTGSNTWVLFGNLVPA